jgi:nicotinate phosphoribosyltransferase
MVVEGYVQDLMDLETIPLSALSERTSAVNGAGEPDPARITETVAEIMDILERSEYGPRPLSYFGARHYGSEWDARLGKAAFDGGATAASTDMGASQAGLRGSGTTPHALLLAFASRYGIGEYQVRVMEAFRKHIDDSVPTVFLADTFNREITDTLKVARALGEDFHGPRFDTNGAVVAEGGVPFDGRKFWTGNGVTVAGVLAARRAFADAGYRNLEIALTSGFSNPEKVRTFVEAEKKYGRKLFGFLGAGFADGRYTATSDIVGYYGEQGRFQELHKVGRPIRPNPELENVDLTEFV